MMKTTSCHRPRPMTIHGDGDDDDVTMSRRFFFAFRRGGGGAGSTCCSAMEYTMRERVIIHARA